MKKTLLFFIAFNAVTSCLCAQNNEKIMTDITYELRFDYDDNIPNTLDSVFNIKCYINPNDLMDYEKIRIVTGKNSKKTKTQEIDISEFRDENGILIDIGIVNEAKALIELYVVDSKGKGRKMSLKKK